MLHIVICNSNLMNNYAMESWKRPRNGLKHAWWREAELESQCSEQGSCHCQIELAAVQQPGASADSGPESSAQPLDCLGLCTMLMWVFCAAAGQIAATAGRGCPWSGLLQETMLISLVCGFEVMLISMDHATVVVHVVCGLCCCQGPWWSLSSMLWLDECCVDVHLTPC